ncbi:MAG: hypothetical protein KC502_14220 [Myxococcales bacterium]|nr:hypothetical protein [Myxococcales bacterium]
MTAQLLVSDTWPAPDLGGAAQVLAPYLRAHPSDLAGQLKRCRGLLDLREHADAAGAAAAAQQAGHGWHAVPAGLAPPLAKALTARGIDPRDPTALKAPVRLTGAPETAPWRQVLAAVPAVWVAQSERRTAPKAKKVGAVGVMKSLATSGGVGLLLAKPTGGGGGALEITKDATPMLVVIAAGGPGNSLRRIHVFANRCDYRVLDEVNNQVTANWSRLLGQIASRVRPDVAGGALLRSAADGFAPPKWLVISDDNELARSVRWLMCVGALRRLGRIPK